MAKTIWEVTPWASLWSMANGGGSPMHSEIAKGMDKAGYKVVHIVPTGYERVERLAGKVGSTRYIGIIPSLFLQAVSLAVYTVDAVRKAGTEARHGKPRIIYAYGSQSALAVWLISRKYHVPSITRLFGTYINPKCSFIEVCIRWQEVLAFKIPCSCLLITDDGTQGDKVAKRLRVPSERVRFWKNGVSKSPNLATHHTDSVMILTSSRLARWKRVDRLLSALPSVLSVCPNVNVVIVGDGDERANLEHQCQRDHLAQVTFAGAVSHEQVLKYIAQADIFVTVNDVTNVSNGLNEAMMAGKCIVALDTGATRDVIQDGVNGLLVPVGSEPDIAESLAKRLTALVQDANLRERLGDGASRYASDQFYTWDHRVAMELTLIKELTSRVRDGE